jgi:hypothetical protein
MASESRPLTRLEQDILRRVITLGEAQDWQFAEQIEDLVVVEEDDDGKIIYFSSPDAQGNLSRRDLARDLGFGAFRGSGGTITDFIVFCDDDGKLSALEIVNYDGITVDDTTVDPAQILRPEWQ